MLRIARILPLLFLAALLAIPAALATDVSRDQDIAVHVKSNLFGQKKFVFPGGSQVPDKADIIREYESKRLDTAFGEVWVITNGEGRPKYMPEIEKDSWKLPPNLDPLQYLKTAYSDEKFQEYGFFDEHDEYRVIGWYIRNGMEAHIPNRDICTGAELEQFVEREDVQWEEHQVDTPSQNTFMEQKF